MCALIPSCHVRSLPSGNVRSLSSGKERCAEFFFLSAKLPSSFQCKISEIVWQGYRFARRYVGASVRGRLVFRE